MNETVTAKVPRQCCINVLGEDATNATITECTEDPSDYHMEQGCLAILMNLVDEHRSGVAVAVGLSIMVMIASIVMAVIVIIDCC